VEEEREEEKEEEERKGRGTSDNFQSHITGVNTIRRRETTEDEIQHKTSHHTTQHYTTLHYTTPQHTTQHTRT
jgi:hypothetical protein